MVGLADPHGRKFHYLRLSIADACNFKCTYCLPDGYQRPAGAAPFLRLDEIRRLGVAFAALGVRKVRVTGGEPTLRRDVVEIIRTLREDAGIETLALTTNGYRLARLAPVLKAAGLDAINISIDSLSRERFREATGMDELPAVRAGLDACLGLDFRAVKINAVLMRGINDDALPEFLALIRETPVQVRFIELMATQENGELFAKRHLRAADFEAELRAMGFTARARSLTDGPATVLAHPDFRGTIGLIAPYSRDFCAGCNRLRVSARGDLHLCLFGDGGEPLRQHLQSDDQREALQAAVLAALTHKTASHRLHERNPGATRNLSTIGG